MLESRHLWLLAARIPRAFSGASLHRRALEAMHAGEFSDAQRLFEAAALRYRAALAVEPLARLRVHQLIARVRATEHPERLAATAIEVERLLSNLSHIESLEPPFELVEAHSLLALWLETADDRLEVASAARGRAA